MRLWHKELIHVLPRQQLLSQWRECCAIASKIKIAGTPNHMLVNKVMEYDVSHFISYSKLIMAEMKKRGYKVNEQLFYKHFTSKTIESYKNIPMSDIFIGWHMRRYLKQCFYNLQEKYDCGGIPQKEWELFYGYCLEHLIEV